jgi:hypothetical protein
MTEVHICVAILQSDLYVVEGVNGVTDFFTTYVLKPDAHIGSIFLRLA